MISQILHDKAEFWTVLQCNIDQEQKVLANGQKFR